MTVQAVDKWIVHAISQCQVWVKEECSDFYCGLSISSKVLTSALLTGMGWEMSDHEKFWCPRHWFVLYILVDLGWVLDSRGKN